jgi:hypothetical protein
MADGRRQRTSNNQDNLDQLLDGKCPWHKDANHTASKCHALSNSMEADDSKRPRYNDQDKAGGSKGSRRNCKELVDKSPGDFQDANRTVNFIYSGSKAPRCQHQLKLDQREVNSVF